MIQLIRGQVAVCVALLLAAAALAGDSIPRPTGDLFRRDNLFAWCIVPFDAHKRGPEERAAMLERLGFKAFAYDYRAEHIPTFDAEIEALQKHHIRLLAWWFPTQLNGEARQILAVLKKHDIHTQLWVMGGGTPTMSVEEQRHRVEAEAARIRPIAEAAEKIGCQVGLYNHGGWFGEPENQLAILKTLRMPNVGIVYNLHHGHEHLRRFPDLLAKMKPHLLALSLNGMDQDGQKNGRQILPIGAGQLDLQLLRIIRDSGWHGPIGILNHTDLDAEARLQDNLEGLDWLVSQLDGKPAGPAPKFRTAPPTQKNASAPHGRRALLRK
jgi:sugar phosphate isomerase/epimerase